VYKIVGTASDVFEMQRENLTTYHTCVNNFLGDIVKIGHDIDSPDYASIILELKQNTKRAYRDLKIFREKISINLLEVNPDLIRQWQEKFYQIICIVLQGTLERQIRVLQRKHPESFNFTCRDVCNMANRYIADPCNVQHTSFSPMVICALFVLNKRLYSLLYSCCRMLEQRTDDEVLQIYNQCWDDYRKNNSTMQIKISTAPIKNRFFNNSFTISIQSPT